MYIKREGSIFSKNKLVELEIDKIVKFELSNNTITNPTIKIFINIFFNLNMLHLYKHNTREEKNICNSFQILRILN